MSKRPPRKATALYQELFASSPDGILLIDPATQRVLEFNDAACRQLGYTREEFAGLGLSDFEVTETPRETAAHVQAILHQGIDQFDTLNRTKAGDLRHMHVWTRTLTLDGRTVFYAIVRDITEHKQAEAALQRSELSLALAQRIAHLGSWMLEVATGALTWSDELCRICGVAPGEVVPTVDAWLARIHPEDRSGMRSWMDAMLSGQEPGALEFRLVRPDGTIRMIEGDGEIHAGATGQPIGLVGTAQDITERREAGQKLKDSESKFRTLFEAAEDAIFLMDAHVFLDCNRRTEVLFGQRKADMIGRSPVEFSPDTQPDGRPSRVRAAEYIQAALAGAPQRFEWQHLHADGTAFDTEVSLNRIDIGGKRMLQAIVHDITERRRGEELRRLQSAALNAAAEAIVITDRAGVIRWVNPAFTALSGYAAEEALGKTPRDLVKSGRHPPEFYDEFWATILAGRTWHGEFVNRRKDGSLYTEEQVVTPIADASGAITHFLGIKQDITGRLKLEAQYRQAQKMEGVGQLASGIAHDFNNLLTVINGMSELAMERVGEADPVHADVQEIHRAGVRAAGLTRQLLAFSRQQLLEPRVMSLNTAIAGMESLLRRLLGEDIDLVVALTPDLGSVKADPGQIEQLITNLAVNARDAMPQGGRLTIETQCVTIDAAWDRRHDEGMPPGSYMRLAVNDTGVGMDEATRARIFEPFFTTKGPGKGTGLGLATVYGIVKQSQGFIWAQSEVGQGTSFRIYLPRLAEPAGTDRPKPVAVASSGTETILLAEDNDGLRLLATRFLEPAGYTVLGAATGEEALRLLEHYDKPVHLLLSDVVMPGMGGRLLWEQLAPIRPGMKVLYMSGYTADVVVRHGVLEAQVPFLNKPFTAAALLGKVREVLDSPA